MSKLRILGLNSAKLYKIKTEGGEQSSSDERLTTLRSDYAMFQQEEGSTRSNTAYGWIREKA